MARPLRAAVAFVLLFACGARADERGVPLITVFPAEAHKAGPQTFDVAQDSRGILYFGNLHGLLTYDGAWWNLMKLPEEQVAFAVATDDRGGVALGLINDFGVLANDAHGAPQYRSLVPLLPKTQREVGEVRGVCAMPGGFLFVAERTVIAWNGRTARVVNDAPLESAPHGCTSDGGAVLLRGPGGLQRFDPRTSRVTPVAFAGERVDLVLRSGTTLLAAVRDRGLFTVDGANVTPWSPDGSRWMRGKIITGGCVLHDGRIVLASRQHGVAVVRATGELEQVIEENSGLPDAVVTQARVDREGALWLTMSGPIVRIDLASPVTLFDARRGVRGSSSDVAHFHGALYVASSHGLYEIANGKTRAFDVEGDGVWRLLVVDDELLVGTTKGMYRLHGDALERLVPLRGEMYEMLRSPTDPARVWLATRQGLRSMRREGTTWRDEGGVPATPEYAGSVLEERDGTLWCGTVFNGIIRIDHARTAQQRVQQYGDGEMNVFSIGGRTVFVRASGGSVESIGKNGTLVRDPLLGHLTAPGGFFTLTEDARGDVWINSTPPRVFTRNANGTYAREGRPLVAVNASDIQNMIRDANGVLWFAADRGLFRYEPALAAQELEAQPPPLIRRVVAGESRVLFGGASTGERVTLRHDFRRLRIEFAPASYRPGVAYQYRLEPIDANWSEWTEQPFIDYTLLEANDYTFRLRARGPAMLPSGEAQWSFTVQPPWHRTPAAYALWTLLALAVLFAIIRVRTAALTMQADRLRRRVEAKTAELRETVLLLEQANTRLEALSLEDDLTGIANRRSFERALSDEWNRARRREQPLALILVDLDYFKDLNDRRGHPAGDDCLRRIGAFLAETIRRSGEVVARYGGEEFAILLPGVDSDGALRVAESLREGIEKLGVPYGNGGGRMTASCGVASLVPGAGMAAESLVAGADRALYAAKHSGRNCVRVADETTTGTWLRDASA
ncbi:MAG: diguanylate cyclase [Acidobacteria bacterium]|nr:diguanylate cyclase [Acidobacteriota bacterium]